MEWTGVMTRNKPSISSSNLDSFFDYDSICGFSNTPKVHKVSRLIRRARQRRRGGEREGRENSQEGRRPRILRPLAIELLIPVASPSRVHVSMFVATLTRRAYLPCRSPVICSPSWPDEEALAAAAATTPSPLQRNYVMLAKLFE